MSTKKSDKPKQSKYQKKCRKRAREARALGLPADTPYPIIWKAQQAEK